MSWNDSTFPEAKDPLRVGWFISYWRITRQTSNDPDYRLESRQFEDLSIDATEEEAIALFDKFVEQKRVSGQIKDLKGLALFLSKVHKVVRISDNTGAIVHD